jgi:hypothetical protein
MKKFYKTISMVLAIIFILVPISNIDVFAADISLNKTTITLEEGATFRLDLKGTSSSKTLFTWVSDNKEIATVNRNGVIRAFNSGETYIRVTVDKKELKCKVNVVNSSKILTSIDVYNIAMPSVVHITYASGGGSGFFIEDNQIVTNYHVIKDALESIKIVDMKGKSYKAINVLGYDQLRDIAVVETKEKGTPIKKNTHKLRAGETVYTLGCPFGIPFVIAQGLLGKTAWGVDGKNTIMHTAPMSSGNSGGPLVNSYGEVIGINTLSSSGETAQLLNYAVNFDEVKNVDLNNPIPVEDFKNRFNLPVKTVKSSDAKIGDYIILGKYEQDNDKNNGPEDIEWLVISETKDSILVVSRYCLDITCWNSNNDFVSWKDSEHRSWLNGSFYTNSFTSSEKDKILYANTDEEITSGFSSSSGSGTFDNVFLLSIEEVYEYMDNGTIDKKASASEYCKSKGAGDFGKTGYTFWSTRSYSTEDGMYLTVAEFGDITSDRPDGTSIVGHMTTRPAMWIKK